jgi:hypothetical protein
MSDVSGDSGPPSPLSPQSPPPPPPPAPRIDYEVREVTKPSREAKKTPTGKRAYLTPEQIERSKLNLAKAKENKDYYKKVRQELGLGARDPIPEKYKRPTKTHKPKVYEEIEKKEIVDPEEVETLKAEVKEKAQEQEKNKALGITKKDSEKTKREKELSRELKEQKLAKIVRTEISEALFQRQALKTQLKMEQKMEKEAEKKQDEVREEEQPKKQMRMRLADGRIITI